MKCFSACSELPKSFGTKSNCSTNQDGNTACSLSCRPGLIFSIANPPLDEYICGLGTAYEWNGIPPACGRKLLNGFDQPRDADSI